MPAALHSLEEPTDWKFITPKRIVSLNSSITPVSAVVLFLTVRVPTGKLNWPVTPRSPRIAGTFP